MKLVSLVMLGLVGAYCEAGSMENVVVEQVESVVVENMEKMESAGLKDRTFRWVKKNKNKVAVGAGGVVLAGAIYVGVRYWKFVMIKKRLHSDIDRAYHANAFYTKDASLLFYKQNIFKDEFFQQIKTGKDYDELSDSKRYVFSTFINLQFRDCFLFSYKVELPGRYDINNAIMKHYGMDSFIFLKKSEEIEGTKVIFS